MNTIPNQARFFRYFQAANRMLDRAHATRRCGKLERAGRLVKCSNRLARWGMEAPHLKPGTPRTKDDLLNTSTRTLEVTQAL